MGRIYGRSATDFAAEAMRLALHDAGLDKRDVDGLLMNVSMSPEMSPALQMALGLEDLTVLNAMSASGSTAGTMLQYASMALESGQARAIALVFADAPLTPGRRISQTGYGGKGLANGAASFNDLQRAYGDWGGANTSYALAANRHMSLFGTTSEQLGAIAVAERQWAVKNPWVQMREPMTIEDHQNSRYIVEPLHLLDCCLVSNGAVALIRTMVLREGRGRTIRRGWQAGARGVAADQHGRWPALRLLHVGFHPSVRGCCPGARTGGRPSGAEARHGPGERERRDPQLSLDEHPQPPSHLMETSAGADPAAVFFAAAARGELALRRCAACNKPAWPVAQFGMTLHACPSCLHSPLGWTRASGRGTIRLCPL